ncbi:MAG: 50S ribosomal protein L10 [Spirochaetales bacterium]|jgi:large subunit ribosomal protein L10|nr:50S ribosomal protein L10 [Spirochaetales bacterium]
MAEYKTKKAQYKVDAVAEMKTEFSNYDGYVFADYRGMSVDQITELRTKLMPQEASFRVVKNRFAKIAMSELKVEGVDEHFVGPTAVLLTKGEDASSLATKILYDYVKSTPLEVKGAYLNGQLFGKEEIDAYSKLPTRLELIAMVMGTIKAPLSKLARTLQAIVDSKEN